MTENPPTLFVFQLSIPFTVISLPISYQSQSAFRTHLLLAFYDTSSPCLPSQSAPTHTYHPLYPIPPIHTGTEERISPISLLALFSHLIQTRMQKKIIGIDCDEVLCLLMKDFIPYMSKKLNLGMKYEDMKEYDLNKYFHLDKKPVV